MEEAVDSLVRRQAVQASPVASALKLYAMTDASSSSKESKHTEKEAKHQEKEEDEHSVVNSDKSRLSHAMQQMDRVASGLQSSVKNETRAEALAAKVAKSVFDEAAKHSKAEKEKATKDFHSYLNALESANSTEESHALKTVKDQARYLDRLDRKERKMAKEMLQRKHDLQKTTVQKSYHNAHHAAMDLLRDKDHLENAMRAAGAKEQTYEVQEEKNEANGEKDADRSADLSDDATDAAENLRTSIRAS